MAIDNEDPVFLRLKQVVEEERFGLTNKIKTELREELTADISFDARYALIRAAERIAGMRFLPDDGTLPGTRETNKERSAFWSERFMRIDGLKNRSDTDTQSISKDPDFTVICIYALLEPIIREWRDKIGESYKYA